VSALAEIWKPIPYVKKYEVSNYGRVRHSATGVLKRLTRARSGYLVVNLYADGLSNVRNVHSIVAEAFIGSRASRHVVAHIDGDPTNNRSENLRYELKSKVNTDCKSNSNPTVGKLTLKQAREIRRRARAGERTLDLAREFGVSLPTISAIKYRRKWTDAG
jgi:hypothetical protein